MANSQYEYVKQFEHDVSLLPATYIVVRIDGRGFHRLSAKYGFQKPNDRRALDLMNAAASSVLRELPDITFAYGVSDEYSFIFHQACKLFDRRQSKILTTVVSTFTSYFVHLWPTYFLDQQLSAPMPSFDGRTILYPSTHTLRDYVSWRQADCHINNLYNTAFWTLVEKGGISNVEAEKKLQGTQKDAKNDIMYGFGINYNNEPEIYRKGTIIYRDYSERSDEPLIIAVNQVAQELPDARVEKERKRRPKATISQRHVNVIKDEFWQERPWLL